MSNGQRSLHDEEYAQLILQSGRQKLMPLLNYELNALTKQGTMASVEEDHDLRSLLFSSGRDYLIRSNGDQVKKESLEGKIVGLYFSASWCGPCRRFTPVLTEAYNELAPHDSFEIVFVTADKDAESFESYFSKMPWLAIPFSDSELRDQLNVLLSVNGIPRLVILNDLGQVLTEKGVSIIQEHGHLGFPFSEERITEVEEQEEEARRNQCLRSILVSCTRDFVIASDGRNVPVSELEGKTVGIYFSLDTSKPSNEFTEKLVQVYKELKQKGADFEIVMISLDEEIEAFQHLFSTIPWLSLPFQDKKASQLIRYFDPCTIPTLTIIGPDGKTLHSNVTEAVEDHGALAYPFTPEKLEEIEKAREASQTLESLLVAGDKDFVIEKDGSQTPVSSLVGNNIVLYFSAYWSPLCHALLPKFIKAYHKIKAKDGGFEIIFISGDNDQESFDEFYSRMPWPALPYGDERNASISRILKVQVPALVAIAPTGRTVTKDVRSLVARHGAHAYPFTDERLKEIEAEEEEIRKGCPDKLNHQLHQGHDLVLSPRNGFVCDGCSYEGYDWSFYCEECDFDLHPRCAMEAPREERCEDEAEGRPDREWVCEGDVCREAQ